MDNDNESQNLAEPELTKPSLTRPMNPDEGAPSLTAPQFTKPTYDSPDMSQPEETFPDPFAEPATEPESPAGLQPLFSSAPEEPTTPASPTLSDGQSASSYTPPAPQLTTPPPPSPRPVPQPRPAPARPSSYVTPPEKKSNTGKIILILVLLLLMCCCLGGAMKWLWDNGDELIGYTSMVLSYVQLM